MNKQEHLEAAANWKAIRDRVANEFGHGHLEPGAVLLNMSNAVLVLRDQLSNVTILNERLANEAQSLRDKMDTVMFLNEGLAADILEWKELANRKWDSIEHYKLLIGMPKADALKKDNEYLRAQIQQNGLMVEDCLARIDALTRDNEELKQSLGDVKGLCEKAHMQMEQVMRGHH